MPTKKQLIESGIAKITRKVLKEDDVSLSKDDLRLQRIYSKIISNIEDVLDTVGPTISRQIYASVAEFCQRKAR